MEQQVPPTVYFANSYMLGTHRVPACPRAKKTCKLINNKFLMLLVNNIMCPMSNYRYLHFDSQLFRRFPSSSAAFFNY